jgi:RimJ/RimL family protein N-acetyltransferase
LYHTEVSGARKNLGIFAKSKSTSPNRKILTNQELEGAIQMTISGDKTDIRSLKPEHLQYVLRFRNAEVPVDKHKLSALHEWYNQIQQDDQKSAFLITNREETPIGEIAYTQRDSETGEVNNIRLAQECQNQGFGTDAMKAFCRHIFSTTGTSRVILFVNQENRIAIRCYEKCGFEEISVQKGINRDLVLVVMELKKPHSDAWFTEQVNILT